ncbi:MAG: hypothetical protein ACXVYY_01035 [Oryzihumus sp.]
MNARPVGVWVVAILIVVIAGAVYMNQRADRLHQQECTAATMTADSPYSSAADQTAMDQLRTTCP